ncbi:unnamed protein product [Lepidochelys kempii]
MFNGNGHLEPGGNPDPPCNCQKSPTRRVVVALTVVSSALIAAIIALAVLTSQLSSADLCPPAGPSCPDGWMGYRGKCYYFSETEGSWTDSRSRCCAPGASLAGIDSEQEMAFLLCHKGVQDHWIGLRREQGQPWKWTNSTKFNHLSVLLYPIPALQRIDHSSKFSIIRKFAESAIHTILQIIYEDIEQNRPQD